MTSPETPRRCEPAAFLSLPALGGLAARCNDDSGFRSWAHRFAGVIELCCEDATGWLRVETGRVTAVGATPEPAATVRIAGGSASWSAITQGLPGGLHRAWRHRMLTFEGDLVAFMRHYKLFWRLGDLLARGDG